MYKKNHGDCGFDVINALIGFNVAEKRMHQLLSRCNDFLTGKIVSHVLADSNVLI